MTDDSGFVALMALTLFNLLNLLVSFGLLRRILELENGPHGIADGMDDRGRDDSRHRC